ncbi:MAG: calcium/sodium antiporter [Paludibacteraceae bacterium]|nr:calcium/sodium antiporter [Paludibacteraceae bacterium]
MTLNVLLLILGFVLLIFGANGLVDGASSVARKFGISDFIIGLTVVAFGTSAPELVVSTVAAIEKSTDIAITNVLGSNIMNVFIILGITALVYPIASTAEARKLDIPMAMFAGLAVLLMTVIEKNSLGRWDGVILLTIFILYLAYTVHNGKKLQDSTSTQKKMMSTWRSLVYVIGGLGTLIIGGKLIVDNAVAIARAMNVSDALIGVTIVALGTSLPELATSVIAAVKKNSGIALGNVVGSNIFNVFLILGVSASICELRAYDEIIWDSAMAALSGLLVWLFVMTNKNHEIKRWHGALLLLMYAAYFVVRILGVGF